MCRVFVLLVVLGALWSTLHSETAAKVLPERRRGDKNFSLTCLLFSDTGCNLECIIISRLYEYQATGECVRANNQKNVCECTLKNGPIHSNVAWKKKFNSDYVYSRIMHSSKAEEAEKILQNPQITGEQLKALFKPLISPYQYSKLIINDNSPAAKYIKNGEVDRISAQKFISDQLDAFIKKSRSLLHTNYRYNFRDDLDDVKDIGTLYNFVYKVTGLGNETLKKELEDFLEKNDIVEPELEQDEEPLVSSTLHYMIVNEFIKRNDDAQKKN